MKLQKHKFVEKKAVTQKKRHRFKAELAKLFRFLMEYEKLTNRLQFTTLYWKSPCMKLLTWKWDCVRHYFYSTILNSKIEIIFHAVHKIFKLSISSRKKNCMENCDPNDTLSLSMHIYIPKFQWAQYPSVRKCKILKSYYILHWEMYWIHRLMQYTISSMHMCWSNSIYFMVHLIVLKILFCLLLNEFYLSWKNIVFFYLFWIVFSF